MECYVTRPLLAHGGCDPAPAWLGRRGSWTTRGEWPARWLESPAGARAAVFRRFFDPDEPGVIRVYVAADGMYDLFLNGQRIGRGPEFAGPGRWTVQAYDLDPLAGRNVLVARAWRTEDRLVRGPAFLLAPHDPDLLGLLATGRSEWHARTVDGLDPRPPGAVRGDRFPWDFEWGEGEGWESAGEDADSVFPIGLPGRSRLAAAVRPTGDRALEPAVLPPPGWVVRQVGSVRQIDAEAGPAAHLAPFRPEAGVELESAAWQSLLRGHHLEVPPHTRRRILVDLGDLFCAFLHLLVSGGKGARIEAGLALGLDPSDEGARLAGPWATWRPDGGDDRHLETLHWTAGRFLGLAVETEDEPLAIQSLWIEESRYPFVEEGRVREDPAPWRALRHRGTRGWMIRAHDRFLASPSPPFPVDAGELRVQGLVNHVISSDDRLLRKSLSLLAEAAPPDGVLWGRLDDQSLTAMPYHGLWQIVALHDLAVWRGGREFVRRTLRRLHHAVEGLIRSMDDSGMVRPTEGWPWLDDVPEWPDGVPPGDRAHPHPVAQGLALRALRATARLESWVGNEAVASQVSEAADRLAEACRHRFWDAASGRLLGHDGQPDGGPHGLAAAVLGDWPDEAMRKALAEAAGGEGGRGMGPAWQISRIEAWAALSRTDLLHAWLDHHARHLDESPLAGPGSGSEAGVAGRCARYAIPAFVAGILPQGLGGETLRIAPRLGALERLEVMVPHPRGLIHVSLSREGDAITATVVLPQGVGGYLEGDGESQALHPGHQRVVLPAAG